MPCTRYLVDNWTWSNGTTFKLFTLRVENKMEAKQWGGAVIPLTPTRSAIDLSLSTIPGVLTGLVQQECIQTLYIFCVFVCSNCVHLIKPYISSQNIVNRKAVHHSQGRCVGMSNEYNCCVWTIILQGVWSHFLLFPVPQLLEGCSSVLPPVSIKQTLPVVYRQYVYFLSSSTAVKLFLNTPEYFLTQNVANYSVPVRVAILGPPKSGKTTGKYNMVVSNSILLGYCLPECWNIRSTCMLNFAFSNRYRKLNTL